MLPSLTLTVMINSVFSQPPLEYLGLIPDSVSQLQLPENVDLEGIGDGSLARAVQVKA